MFDKLRTKAVSGYNRLVSYDKARFLIVGGIGFMVNYMALALFFDLLNLPILVAQIAGVELAVLATFIGNNFWAFKGHHHIALPTKLLKFHVSAAGGLVINSSIVVILVHFAHVYYGLALAVGSVIGLLWNYVLYKRFVFRSHKDSQV